MLGATHVFVVWRILHATSGLREARFKQQQGTRTNSNSSWSPINQGLSLFNSGNDWKFSTSSSAAYKGVSIINNYINHPLQTRFYHLLMALSSCSHIVALKRKSTKLCEHDRTFANTIKKMPRKKKQLLDLEEEVPEIQGPEDEEFQFQVNKEFASRFEVNETNKVCRAKTASAASTTWACILTCTHMHSLAHTHTHPPTPTHTHTHTQTHTHTLTHTHTHTHTHTQTHMRGSARTCTHTCAHKRIRTCVRTHTHTQCVRVHTHTHKNGHRHTYTYTRMRPCTRTRKHIHVHTHTCIHMHALTYTHI